MGLQFIDIEPGGVRQVQRALASGRMVVVTDGPHDVARKLREISDVLRLHYDPYEAVWVVMELQALPDGSTRESLVTTALECDDRLVERVRQIAQPGYDYAGELERVEREADRAHDERRREQVGDVAERLRFALSKDLGRHETVRTLKSRAFVPRDS